MAVLVAGGCSLGLVDAPPPDPAPADFAVRVELGPAVEPGRVRLRVEASLDPEVDTTGVRRAVEDGRLRVGMEKHAAATLDPRTGFHTWSLVRVVPAPGPLTLRISFPAVEGLGRPPEARLQAGLRMASGDTVRLAPDEDLVLEVDAPRAPIPPFDPFGRNSIAWRVELLSAGTGFHLTAEAERWLRRARVASWRIPRDALPLQGVLRVATREERGSEQALPRTERYRIVLETLVTTTFAVVAAPGPSG